MAKRTALVDKYDAAELLGFSVREVEERGRQGLMPRSFTNLEGVDMWRRLELLDWVAKGLPDCQTWEQKMYNPDWDSRGYGTNRGYGTK